MSDSAVAVVSAGVPLNVISKNTSLRPRIDIRLRVTIGITGAKKGTTEQRVDRTTCVLGFERTQSLNRLNFEVISSEILNESQADKFTYVGCKPSSSGLVSVSARRLGEGCCDEPDKDFIVGAGIDGISTAFNLHNHSPPDHLLLITLLESTNYKKRHRINLIRAKPFNNATSAKHHYVNAISCLLSSSPCNQPTLHPIPSTVP
jgi:hypothetical protein